MKQFDFIFHFSLNSMKESSPWLFFQVSDAIKDSQPAKLIVSVFNLSTANVWCTQQNNM